ncbi:hypothetical protein HDA40_004389 [Hamadaea flava]|uniref:Uncharacterized protein n=1 Tax=Hamadaea flava TaxID=1742688 RepID=A0ABV8LE27_9ACTN|nr:hypothetical protein [Hamadaea flava]MCP2325882.1 hypothetical protein [Hamadaea flava]
MRFPVRLITEPFGGFDSSTFRAGTVVGDGDGFGDADGLAEADGAAVADTFASGFDGPDRQLPKAATPRIATNPALATDRRARDESTLDPRDHARSRRN